MVESFEVPRSQQGDSDDVVVSLETARVQAEKSNSGEVLRWIRRAARAAETSGDSDRAATLAHAASELAALMQENGDGGQHVPVRESEQPLLRDYDADFDDKTSVDTRALPDAPEVVDDASEDPTEPRRRVNPMAPALTAPNVESGFQEVQALRVAVDPLAPGSKILVVHLLEEGEAAGPGRREAVLMATDPSQGLLPKTRQ